MLSAATVLCRQSLNEDDITQGDRRKTTSPSVTVCFSACNNNAKCYLHADLKKIKNKEKKDICFPGQKYLEIKLKVGKRFNNYGTMVFTPWFSVSIPRIIFLEKL